jgi:FdhD protein
MAELSREFDIQRSGGQSLTDRVAVEEPLEIQVVSAAAAAAKSVSITMRTPGSDAELALGFLFTEGILSSADQVVGVDTVGQPVTESGEQNTVRITVAADADISLDRLERHFYTTSSCGVCGKASLDALKVPGRQSLENVGGGFAAKTLSALPDRIRGLQPVFAETGGLHAAAVFGPDGEIVVVREDVGRHNATDKAIGALLEDGRLPGHGVGLFVSGRASFELMQKSLVAGIPLLAAVGAPSSLAVDTAREFGMTLVGFLRNGTFNIYAGEERIT